MYIFVTFVHFSSREEESGCPASAEEEEDEVTAAVAIAVDQEEDAGMVLSPKRLLSTSVGAVGGAARSPNWPLAKWVEKYF